ncbi:Zinc finger protein ENHYDROUS [Linum perenne]
MPVDLDNSSTASGEASGSSSGGNNHPSLPEPPQSTPKKKRNLPGMPDPDAEVIALSPKTLMATNRFVCEICNKGFQRDQNLQLHRRGHNLPWKLRQRSSKEVKKRVYVCPESTCVHHDPSRALGDLTGIKKHFCRKHGEKKWKCDKCSKKYAVQSDWKAHSKICGTREYKCDCGTMFSRRDSFITHRAFCDALAEESARAHPPIPPSNRSPASDPKVHADSASPAPAASAPVPAAPQAPSSSVSPVHSPELPEVQDPAPIMEEPTAPETSMAVSGTPTVTVNASCSCSSSSSSNGSTTSTVFASLFASSTNASGGTFQPPPQTQSFTDLIRAMSRPADHHLPPPSSCTEPISLCLSTSHGSSIFGTVGQDHRQYAPPPQQPAMSATALLQKAAQMGAAATNASLLRGLGIVSSSSPSAATQHDSWGQGQVIEPESSGVHPGLGLGLPCDGGSGLKELMMGTPSMFGPKHATLDFLGLGMAVGGSPSNGLSALITSIGSGLDVGTSFGGGEFAGKDIGSSS